MGELVERCEHESDDAVTLEYSVGEEFRRFVSCGLAACNDRGAEWLAAQEAAVEARQREVGR